MNNAGINVDLFNDSPSIRDLGSCEAVRYVFNVSQGAGNEDFARSIIVHKGYAKDAINVGMKVFQVINHQTWGEAQGYNWPTMSYNDWYNFMTEFLSKIYPIFTSQVGMGIYYQFFNEVDTPLTVPEEELRAIRLEPSVYGMMFNRFYAFVKSIDNTAKVVTSGFVNGTGSYNGYFKLTGIKKCDGVCFHPYLAESGGEFGNKGIPSLKEQARVWHSLASTDGYDCYITEFGVLNQKNASSAKVSRYISAAVKDVRQFVKALIYYAWNDKMDNGYGVRDDKIKVDVWTALFGNNTQLPEIVISPYSIGNYRLSFNYLLNVRDKPNGIISGTLSNGSKVTFTEKFEVSGNYVWQEINGGWIAVLELKNGEWELPAWIFVADNATGGDGLEVQISNAEALVNYLKGLRK